MRLKELYTRLRRRRAEQFVAPENHRLELPRQTQTLEGMMRAAQTRSAKTAPRRK